MLVEADYLMLCPGHEISGAAKIFHYAIYYIDEINYQEKSRNLLIYIL